MNNFYANKVNSKILKKNKYDATNAGRKWRCCKIADLTISSKSYPYFSRLSCSQDYGKRYFATAPKWINSETLSAEAHQRITEASANYESNTNGRIKLLVYS